ncbi:RNA polymerase sigma factor [Flavisolibacter ginsengisoli]|jgi:RNA polymerase sigma-70 factor (ECF subfamily)|uniref:RNA polymerase sigma-70 factor, ECF subfamily n=1 Tax=Flavisolibacter ginsengisoli DSM 18119 TaxID=1121884 RepID=A0A1M5GI44_9BACT|nr:sigma-70 family RNA polymerase sigma factor [Flavisolibacter ginsengisoli]SHG03425.1 RNA polymerase sigma-70 factor, ECF subfamily [Flavisolibacter ginsengisoli DSM 18119]
MSSTELIPHLFRTEFSKIVSVLSKQFGMEQMEWAEDIASETFLSALHTWPYKGVPGNPEAWLYTVARNKALNDYKRNRLFAAKISPELKQTSTALEEMEIDLSATNISDSQLQMLFAVCHPSIPPEAQVALALRVLCGLGIDEIATAFLTSKDVINKRLYRAKEKLRQEDVLIEMPPDTEIIQRLDTVLTTLYLLFNEGYYSESQDAILRQELCEEAMRLTELLIENKKTALPFAYALYALMCFHASRFAARKDNTGAIILYADQDDNLWDRELIARGAYHLHLASVGDNISRYHLEAAIAYWHTQKADTPEKWESILQLYNQLLRLHYSPVAALNRTFALYKANGREQAIKEAEQLQLSGNHYYHILLGELYKETDTALARQYFENALKLASNATERKMIVDKIECL